jgi:segregation and condensation protein B
MENSEKQKQIESVLFWKGEPTKISELAKILNCSEKEISAEIENLKQSLEGRGVVVVETEKEVSLVTAPENSELIQQLQKEELTKDLSKATLETLTIVLYRGPVKRAEIDYIRGVNSQFTLRTLLVRGLIEKKQASDDERAYVYAPSIEALNFLGVSDVKELPEYSEVNSDIENFLNAEEDPASPEAPQDGSGSAEASQDGEVTQDKPRFAEASQDKQNGEDQE